MRRSFGRILGSARRFGSSSSAGRSSQSKLLTTSLIFSSGLASGLLAYNQFKAAPDTKANSTLPLDELKEPKYASLSEEKAAVAEIKKIVGNDNVTDEADLLDTHADSGWQTRHPKKGEKPQTIVYPSSTEEVSKILKICHDYRVPVTAFSGGTSLEGHFTPVYGGISLDMSNMCNILAVHKDDLDVVVQPAIGWEDLNDQLKPYDVFFGPDPGPGAQIGGMTGTCCSGTNAYRYGTMRQNVVNLTVVLADGSIIKTRQRPRKSSAGYSLTDVFVGAEGTLGIVTEATLKLHPIPPIRRVGLLTFDTPKNATDTVEKILQSGLILDAMEFLDDNMMKIINDSGATDRKWSEKHTLLLRFAGSSDSTVENLIEDVKKISVENKSLSFEFAKNEDETEELWSARKTALWSVFFAAPKGHKCWTTDVAVPISHLTEIISKTKEELQSLGIRGGIVGHVGDGNFHALLTYDPETQTKEVSDAVHLMIKRALALDGTCTGEHGVGVGKRHYVIEEVGQIAVDAMRQLKQAYDPHMILNPGKVFSISRTHDVSDH